MQRIVHVHLLPELVPEGVLPEGIAVVIDVLRATTTIIHALAAGCSNVRPCLEIDEAKELAGAMRVGDVLLGGERGGESLPGFDLGNSPSEFIPELCKGKTLVMTTTNGTKAILRAMEAQRLMLAAFVNFSAVCEQIREEKRPVHIICSGSDGSITLEDTLLAGAFVEFLCDEEDIQLNDSARLAWDSFENHGEMLQEAIELSQGGAILTQLGYHDDIRIAAQIDKFTLVPELRTEPLRIEVGAVGIRDRHWMK